MGRMKPWHIYEPCAGSAALTYYLSGATRSILPYQGSKWKHRRELEEIVRELGFEGAPSTVWLEDIGPWGSAHRALAWHRPAVLEGLAALAEEDAAEVYVAIMRGELHLLSTVGVVQFLFLQRLAWGGKAVGTRSDGSWISPGFNETSAYGTPERRKCLDCATKFFVARSVDDFENARLKLPVAAGKLCPLCSSESERVFSVVRPMIPSLIRTVEALPALRHRAPGEKRRLAYIDPNYQGSTGYPNGSLSRAEVLSMARDQRRSGAAVMVSEAEPLQELITEGWETVQLGARTGYLRDGGRRTKEEWVTFVGG